MATRGGTSGVPRGAWREPHVGAGGSRAGRPGSGSGSGTGSGSGSGSGSGTGTGSGSGRGTGPLGPPPCTGTTGTDTPRPPAPQPPRASGAKRLELGRQQMEHTVADPYLVRLKHLKLQRHLAAVSARQQLALRRNRALRREFLQLEAHMETTGWESIRKMEWYGREIKNLLSLQEGSLSAGGDKEEGSSEQVLQTGEQAGIGTSTAKPGELGLPAAALLGCPTSAASATGGLGSQQDPPERSTSPEGLGPEAGSAAGEGEEGAAGHGDLAAGEEGSEQLISASGAGAAPRRQGQRQGSVPGAKPGLSSWRAHREGSSAELPVPAGAEEEAKPSVPDTRQEQDGDAQTPEGSLLPPLSPPAAQEEPLDSSAPHRPGGMLAELSELCRALQLLEDLVETTSPQHRALYQGQPSGTAELPSAHGEVGELTQGDLEVIEAVVLRQLLLVSRRTRSGSLPLENTGGAAGRAGHEEHTRDTDALRTRLSHHGLFLKQRQVRLPERVAEMFEQLLASGEEAQDGQSQVVLGEALLGERRRDGSPVQSDESSRSLPLIPTNGGEGKQLESREPGWDRSHNSPKGSDSLEAHSGSSSLSDGSAPPFSRTELRKEPVTVIRSKAFWGESDDSSSELEAALRPQTHSTGSDDFGDFYD
ncbi:centrosomal protein kizuna isoform X2 [Corvus hawaiiensis]|uniref:centrosomal protein kizuna isoform X2 n=1 Tax=Corvus hawaiiensis TaxID=134902 RepID=UPI00201975BD|nr:centrosomal protein kizuna isoform X2 [Corvus hawaiiensis]